MVLDTLVSGLPRIMDFIRGHHLSVFNHSVSSSYSLAHPGCSSTLSSRPRIQQFTWSGL